MLGYISVMLYIMYLYIYIIVCSIPHLAVYCWAFVPTVACLWKLSSICIHQHSSAAAIQKVEPYISVLHGLDSNFYNLGNSLISVSYII